MGSDAVSVDISHVDGAVLVDVDGALDASSVSILRGILLDLPASCHVSIDMANVRLMDSSGSNLLAAHALRLRAGGGSLKISQPSPAVRPAIEIAGMGALIENRPRPKPTERNSPPLTRKGDPGAQGDMGRLPTRPGYRR